VSPPPLREVTAIKTAVNTHDIEAHEDRLTRIEAKVDVMLGLISDVAAGVTELLRRVP
jgi:hypothetical protein